MNYVEFPIHDVWLSNPAIVKSPICDVCGFVPPIAVHE